MTAFPGPPSSQLSKSGSISPSVRRLFSRYPPAIIDDDSPTSPVRPIPMEHMPSIPQQVPFTSFETRFPEGYKVADSSIPIYPDEVPPGYEKLFNPNYKPPTRMLFFCGFLCPLLWFISAGMVLYRRVGLNGIIDARMYWTRVQWLKLNGKYGLWSGLAFIITILVLTVIIMVVKAYGPNS